MVKKNSTLFIIQIHQKSGFEKFANMWKFLFFWVFTKVRKSDRCEVVVERSDRCEVGAERSVLVRSGP